MQCILQHFTVHVHSQNDVPLNFGFDLHFLGGFPVLHEHTTLLYTFYCLIRAYCTADAAVLHEHTTLYTGVFCFEWAHYPAVLFNWWLRMAWCCRRVHDALYYFQTPLSTQPTAVLPREYVRLRHCNALHRWPACWPRHPAATVSACVLTLTSTGWPLSSNEFGAHLVCVFLCSTSEWRNDTQSLLKRTWVHVSLAVDCWLLTKKRFVLAWPFICMRLPACSLCVASPAPHPYVLLLV